MPPLPLHLGPYETLAAAVAEQLETSRNDDPLRAWRVEVVAASQGVAEAIARALVARGKGIAGLQLRTLDALARSIANAAGEFPRVASDAERRLAMRSAVRAIDDPIAQSRGIAAMLERSYRDVRDSGLTLDEIRRRTRNAPLRNTDRTRLILRAWTEYERLVALLGATDPASLLARAAQLIDSGAPIAPQIVAGFYDQTGAQRAVVEALARKGKLAAVYAPAGESEAYRFAQPFIAKIGELAHVIPSVSEGSGRPGGSNIEIQAAAKTSAFAPPALPDPSLTPGMTAWTITEYERRDVEIRETCAAVAALLASGTAPQSIGIGARSLEPADVHLFGRFARQFGFRTTASEELPLIAHRIGRAIAAILRLREHDFPRAGVLEIVRDGFRAKTRINVDKADPEARKYRITGGGSAGLEMFRSRSLVLGDYIDLVKELEELTQPLASTALRGSEWSDFLAALAGRFAPRTETDLAALYEIDAIAALFGRADRMNLRFDAAAVMDAMEQAAITVPDGDADETPLVWLGDVMRFRGRSFEHLFAVRMQDEIFPQRRTEDPLLPDSDRRALDVRQIGDGRDEERLLFQLMLDGARSIHFSFAGSDGFGRTLRPSQLLKNFVIEQWPERKQELLRDFSRAIAEKRLRGSAVAQLRGDEIGDRETAELRNRATQLMVRSGTNGVFDGFVADPALLEHFTGALEHVSPTQLEEFGECPQKFLLKFMLKVESIEDPDRELQINPRDKGSLDHRILENFYRSLSEEEFEDAVARLPQLPTALAERLERAIEAEFDRLDENAPPFNRAIRQIERRATRRILRDFVVRDLADLAESGLRPRWFEYSFGDKYQRRGGATHPEPFVIRADGVPIHVDGQIDRIDVGVGAQGSGPGGKSEGSTPEPPPRYRIVDYKSGKALRHTRLADKIDRGVRLQLPLYAMAVAEFFGVDKAAVDGTIKPLVSGSEHKPATYAFALAEHDEIVRTTLDIFVRAVRRGAFPAFPEERDFDSCKYCPVNHSCRTRHDPEEKWAVTRMKDPRTLLQGIDEVER